MDIAIEHTVCQLLVCIYFCSKLIGYLGINNTELFLGKKRRISEDINKFRDIYQKPENRRDFDLYVPDGLKNSLPARLMDKDPRCGPSSAQKYET